MSFCKYSFVCHRVCTENCKDYEENKDFEYLDLQYDSLKQFNNK